MNCNLFKWLNFHNDLWLFKLFYSSWFTWHVAKKVPDVPALSNAYIIGLRAGFRLTYQ